MAGQIVPSRASRTTGSGATRSARRSGFTLVEIMVVVIVLAILAATIIPQFAGTTQEAKATSARAMIAVLENAIERFYIHMDRYPTTPEGLESLVRPPSEGASGWRGPYIKELRPDPWGRPFMYRSPGVHGSRTYDLWSLGADGKDGGAGPDADITSWQESS